MNSIQKDPEMDCLTDSMSNLNLKNTLCEICKGGVEEIIQSPCPKKCVIMCHIECFNRWIVCKRWNAYCIKCAVPLDPVFIDNILFNNERKYHRF